MTATQPNLFKQQTIDFDQSKKNSIKIKTGTENWHSNYQEQCDHDDQNCQGRRADWTYYKKPYRNDIEIGNTEYQKKIGFEGPMKVKGRENSVEYRRWLYDDLKEGTT